MRRVCSVTQEIVVYLFLRDNFKIIVEIIFVFLYTMFRNSVQNVAGNQMAPSISRFMRTMNLSTCVYYSDLWFSNNPDSNKCQEILCLVCRCLDQIYNCINRLILRLHKVTCLLLRQKPARRNDLDPLPDILKGT